MKLLLVLGSDDNYKTISQFIKPLGFELIRYRYVLKAMDNIDEVNPRAIIISAADFPRHWKILVQFVRSERLKEDCPIIILKGQNFSTEETSKASFLGVNGIVSGDFENHTEIDRLQNILGRYMPINEKRRHRRFFVIPQQHIGFLFANPKDRSIITGEVKTISAGGISFLPDQSAFMKDISLDMEFAECSLRIDNNILSPVCKLVRTGRTISFEFVSFPNGETGILEQYLSDLEEKENF
jgi:hypothetical protein